MVLYFSLGWLPFPLGSGMYMAGWRSALDRRCLTICKAEESFISLLSTQCLSHELVSYHQVMKGSRIKQKPDQSTWGLSVWHNSSQCCKEEWNCLLCSDSECEDKCGPDSLTLALKETGRVVDCAGMCPCQHCQLDFSRFPRVRGFDIWAQQLMHNLYRLFKTLWKSPNRSASRWMTHLGKEVEEATISYSTGFPVFLSFEEKKM